MVWKIDFTDAAQRQFYKLDPQISKRILSVLNNHVAPLDNPRLLGAPLQGSKFGEFWKYRVGDYRIIARIEDESVRILVVRIANRREVYR
jgi:mRNA interferase RelE/StbE